MVKIYSKRFILTIFILFIFSFLPFENSYSMGPMEAFPCESVGGMGAEIVDGCCLDPTIVDTSACSTDNLNVCVGHNCDQIAPDTAGCDYPTPNTNAVSGMNSGHFTRCDWVPRGSGAPIFNLDMDENPILPNPSDVCDVACVDYGNGNAIDADCSGFGRLNPPAHENDRLEVDPTICDSGGGTDGDDDDDDDNDDDNDDGPPDTGDPSSDANHLQLYCFYDLRNRDSFCQVTNNSNLPVILHVQVFNVGDNCNENNFYDTYTGNDTHVYNLSDIVANDGNPSGIVLPDDAYGFVAVTAVSGIGGFPVPANLIGNFRVISSDGAEYRTNALGISDTTPVLVDDVGQPYTFNFNQKHGVILSDVVGITVDNLAGVEVINNISTTWAKFDVNIINNSEVVFSCRDIVFACTDQDHPLLKVLLSNSNSSIASFEYGINNAISHTHDGELLCPGNNIPEGVVELKRLAPDSATELFIGYIGLNNGNGRGSMDSFWTENNIGQAQMMMVGP